METGKAYRLTTTGHSSNRYGACEVCNKHASEVFQLVRQRGFLNPETGMVGFTYHQAGPDVFGHFACVTALTN
jgi:hypothetical protein